ncbi:hypothetical protein PX554_13910 [Sphingomonas sp. H39-1-10]|uniref:hypothetical protein n=1 Tax=Sphingomonas pollutisoli TaxID=3030829 RepID=UPI0023B9CE59|nr:hypothetical protein [Sphingomonas pollutisoli]MDF0489232.1 hypothetical protein [Sphingomonas pollutisoli]
MRLVASLAVAAAVLASCSNSPAYDPERCAATDPTVTHLSADAQICIEKWGKALSTSPDPAGDVAEAVHMACNDILSDGIATDDEDANETAASAQAEGTEARRLATFWVVEERAGHCSLKK